ncbi:MAG: 3-dehydroquinate synthase [Acidobacteria bacterium]|nr:3-dehydroquinate synthase [Acidobacteriota bacterium]MBV9474519.1 3-dehydroquinate synthase [Acidobacteriota bacterium]
MTPFLVIRQSSDYPVYVERGALDRVGEAVRPRGRVFVITSHALRERFGMRVARSFRDAEILTIEEGEANKTLATANDVVTQLLDRGARRDAMAVVVGGGMLGDTAGFAASIYLRGIDLVHVPTTLLAQVDSSIGGKLAVNHEKGKNLIGSFYPPRAVVSDLEVLDTLPPRERLSGLYEALKGGVIGDPLLFERFEGDAFDLDAVVRAAIRVKAEIVSADEREADLRRLLNYGHTIAHGIEAALHYEGLTHGEAVAWGMIGANAIAVRRGLLARDEAARIERAIRKYEPSPLPKLDRRDILAATEHDKKNTGTARVMVFPRKVGECVVVSDVTEDEIAYGIDAIL